MSTEDHNEVLSAIQSHDGSMLSKLPIHVEDPDYADLLHYAAGLGNANVVEILLRKGWSSMVNYFDDMGFTPLHWAAKNGHGAVVKVLLASGADVNAHYDAICGNTPLREVIETATPEIVKLLLDAGADERIPGWMQLSALDVAKERNNDRQDEASKMILDALCKNRNWA